MFEKKIFGAMVRSLRQGKACTQTDLAVYLGVTKTQISDIENGKIATTIEKLCALADFFGVPLDYLVGKGPFAHWDALMHHRDAFVHALEATAPGIPWAVLPDAGFIALCGAILSRAEVSDDGSVINLYPQLSPELLKQFGAKDGET